MERQMYVLVSPAAKSEGFSVKRKSVTFSVSGGLLVAILRRDFGFPVDCLGLVIAEDTVEGQSEIRRSVDFHLNGWGIHVDQKVASKRTRLNDE